MKNDSILACLFLSLLSCPGAGNAAGEPGQYRVVGGESEVNILVFRAGSLGRFGHNHVVTARQITGCVTVGETAADSSLELSLPVEELAVDDPESRAAAGSAF
ncbi:MAG TPA: hypothetical protein VE175_06775, partial [Woeseiaceae bacterium]|nr:hypothetical protein [Woeseiaceae bacterium]